MIFDKEKYDECYKKLEEYCKKENNLFSSSDLYWLINKVKISGEIFVDFLNRKKDKTIYLPAINEQRFILEDTLRRIKELSGYNFRIGFYYRGRE